MRSPWSGFAILYLRPCPEQGVLTVPHHRMAAGCRGDTTSPAASLYLLHSLLPQSRVTLLDLAPATHGNALHAEWNETRRTQRKAEQVPDGRCTAGMHYQSYSSDLHTGAQTACTAARTTAQHNNTCPAHQHLPKQALSFLWWAFLSFFSRLTCPYL